MTAAFFAECFTGCSGPGNCGWTILSAPGTVVFDGVKILEGSSGASPQGRAVKALPVTPSGAFTAQFKIQEVATPPSGGKNYLVGMSDALGINVFAIVLVGDGTLIIGDQFNVYTGAWTPVAGATHTVHITDDGTGILTLYIDGIVIPLVFLQPGPITDVPSVVDTIITNNDLDGQGAFDNIFLTSGVLPPSTVFCCP